MNNQETYKILIKDNEQTIIKHITPEIAKNIKLQKDRHLCSEACANAYTTKCPKIADLIKQDIGKYDFISHGYQIIQPDGELDCFVVQNCKNYEFQEQKGKVKVDKERARKLKESLITNYFDAETYEEAEIIQYELAQRGYITEARGGVINEHKYKVLKKEFKKNF